MARSSQWGPAVAESEDPTTAGHWVTPWPIGDRSHRLPAVPEPRLWMGVGRGVQLQPLARLPVCAGSRCWPSAAGAAAAAARCAAVPGCPAPATGAAASTGPGAAASQCRYRWGRRYLHRRPAVTYRVPPYRRYRRLPRCRRCRRTAAPPARAVTAVTAGPPPAPPPTASAAITAGQPVPP